MSVWGALVPRYAADPAYCHGRPDDGQPPFAGRGGRSNDAAAGTRGWEADFAELMEKLRAAVDPATATDLRGLELLARNEAALGNLAAAEAAQRRIIAVKGDAATAEDHAALAEVMIRAAAAMSRPRQRPH